MNEAVRQPKYPLSNPPSENEPKYPSLCVPLPTKGPNSDSRSIIFEVVRYMEAGQCPKADIDKFTEEAMFGQPEDLKATCEKYVTAMWDHYLLDYDAKRGR